MQSADRNEGAARIDHRLNSLRHEAIALAEEMDAEFVLGFYLLLGQDAAGVDDRQGLDRPFLRIETEQGGVDVIVERRLGGGADKESGGERGVQRGQYLALLLHCLNGGDFDA